MSLQGAGGWGLWALHCQGLQTKALTSEPGADTRLIATSVRMRRSVGGYGQCKTLFPPQAQLL